MGCPTSRAAMPLVMNVKMAASLGLCRPPKTAAEGLALFRSGGAMKTVRGKPATQPKAVASHPTKPKAAKVTGEPVSRFAHLAGATFCIRPRASASTAAEAAEAEHLPRNAQAVRAAQVQRFATAQAAAEFILAIRRTPAR